ncbi:MAG: GLUG motif-containing protein [Candidatus Woesearchaeota archaeon]
MQEGNEYRLVGQVARKYNALIGQNPYWNATSGMGCFDASVDPIPLCTCFDLDLVRSELTSNFAMQNNIDFLRCNARIGAHGWNTGEGWLPIGAPSSVFSGNFDGQNNFIGNLFLHRPTFRSGFFREIDSSEINNLGFIAANIHSESDDVGTVVGYSYRGLITNSYVIGDISGGGSRIGGLIGESYYGEISNSYVIGTVSGLGSNSGGVGGLVGAGGMAEIKSSFFSGLVTGGSSTGTGIGGLGGDIGVIYDSYAIGVINGREKVGGLVGQGYVYNSFFIGNVTGSWEVGGLVGSGGEVMGSYAKGFVSGNSYVGGLNGAEFTTITMTNSYSETVISCSGTFCGGLIAGPAYMGSHTISNSYWINHTDDAFSCIGDGTNPAGCEAQ